MTKGRGSDKSHLCTELSDVVLCVGTTKITPTLLRIKWLSLTSLLHEIRPESSVMPANASRYQQDHPSTPKKNRKNAMRHRRAEIIHLLICPLDSRLNQC
jgi:hypothetical protein